jgi:stage II sporulation protein AA (anti-sigma F factor antagonist)
MSQTREASLSPAFAVTALQEGPDRRLRLAGEFDLAGFDAANAVLEDVLAERPATVVIDLSELTFMDSTGLRFVVGAQVRCVAAGRPLVIRQGGPTIHRLFEMTRLDTVLPFER